MPRPAGPPFGGNTADIVICSLDDVAFKLHRDILCIASEFFKDMLSLPQPSTDERGSSADLLEFDGLPSVRVSEQSDVLERLFRLCYPVDDPPLQTMGEVRSTLEAAMKYQMAEAIKITKRRLLALARNDPLRVYAVACCFNLEEEASVAAKEVLKQNAHEDYVDELEDISIGAYHRLLSYCERRGRVRDQYKFTIHRTSGRGTSVTSTPTLDAVALDTPDAALEPRAALDPFNDPEAEVTLVTADGVEFRVFKKILQFSSPVLYSTAKELLASDRTTVHVAEPSRILDILLRLCYPVLEPDIEDLHDISIALAAAEKYNMQRASQVLRAALASRRDTSSADSDPVVLYAMACRFDMRDLAVAAARRALRTEIMRSSVSELDTIGVSGGCLYRLLEYQRRCKSAIRSIFNGTDWIESDMLARLQDCCSLQVYHPTRNPCWYDEYMSCIGEQGWPKVEMVQDDLFLLTVLESAEKVQRMNYSSCSSCFDRRGTFLLISFSKCVAKAIEALEKKVTLKWTVPPQAQ